MEHSGTIFGRRLLLGTGSGYSGVRALFSNVCYSQRTVFSCLFEQFFPWNDAPFKMGDTYYQYYQYLAVSLPAVSIAIFGGLPVNKLSPRKYDGPNGTAQRYIFLLKGIIIQITSVSPV